MNDMSVAAGAAWVLLVAYVVLITVGIAGAVCSIIGLVRGVSSRNATVVALGGIGFGCAVFGVFVFRIVLWIAGLACGAMACQLSTQPHVPSFEEYKQQKAMLEDPEYAEYMRNVHGVEAKHGGKAKQPMSGGKVGAIVLIIFAVLAVCAFAFGSAANNGTFDHLGGAPAVEQQEDVHTIEDLGDGTILFLLEH